MNNSARVKFRLLLSVALAGTLAIASVSPANAQMLLLGVGSNRPVSGGSYSGPGDVVASALGWWGLRAYDGTKAAALTAALQLCTSGDAVCTDIHVTSTGGLNTSEISSAGCSTGGACTAKTVYDQSGNGHNCTNATEGARPFFNKDYFGAGKPGIYAVNGSNRQLNCASLPTQAVPFTYVTYTAKEQTPGGNDRTWVAADPVGVLYTPSNNFAVYAGSLASSSFTATLNTGYAVIGMADATGAACKVSVSGNVTTGLSCGTNSTGTPGEVVSSNRSGIREWGYYGIGFSVGEITAMDSNMQGF